MSCQRGNAQRSRPQKHQNVTQFKNNKYDTSKQMKQLNSMEITSLCPRCTSIIEWKIKFKKYKTMSAPSQCVKCREKRVNRSYHTICSVCVEQLGVCGKCGKDLNNDDDELPAS